MSTTNGTVTALNGDTVYVGPKPSPNPGTRRVFLRDWWRGLTVDERIAELERQTARQEATIARLEYETEMLALGLEQARQLVKALTATATNAARLAGAKEDTH